MSLLSWLGELMRARNVVPLDQPVAPAATAFLLAGFLLLAVCFLAALLLFAIGCWVGNVAFVALLRTFGVGFTALAASFLVGAGAGFIFAIPRAVTPSASSAGAGATPLRTPPAAPSTDTATPDDKNGPKALSLSLFGSNSNLEKVSDWLTTILVGISLTQFDAIMQRLDRAGFALSCAMSLDGATNCTDKVIGHAIIIFGAALGFLWLYLWTRRYLLGEWTRGVTDALKVERDSLAGQVARNAELGGFVGGTKAGQSAVAANVEEKGAAATPAEAEGALEQRLSTRIKSLENASTPTPLLWASIQPLLGVPSTPRPDDPWWGRFGGKSLADGYRVEAYVSPNRVRGLSHSVRITVSRPAGSTASSVRFFIHPTFPHLAPVVGFDASGKATLDLLAYGAFTVGVAVADPATSKPVLLECDLTEVDAPSDWKAR